MSPTSAVTADTALAAQDLRRRLVSAFARTVRRAIDAHAALHRTRDALRGTDGDGQHVACSSPAHAPTMLAPVAPVMPPAAWHRPLSRALASPSPTLARLCHTAFSRWLDLHEDAASLRALASAFALPRAATFALAALCAVPEPITPVELADALGGDGEPDGPPTRAALVRQLLPGAPLVTLGLVVGGGPLAPTSPAPHLFERSPPPPPLDPLAPSRPLPPPDPDDPLDLLAAAVQSAVEGGALHGTSDAWQAALRELALLDAALSFDCPGADALVRMVRTGATMAACCVAAPGSGSEDTRALVAALDGGPPEVLAEWLRWLIARATERLTAGEALAALALARLALRTPRESADPSLEAAALRVAAMAAEASGAESPARLWALCADAAPEPALREYARARALPGFGALAAWGPR